MDDFETYERAGWERKAGPYSVSCRPITHRLIDPLLDAAHVAAGMRVLDVGTGPGDVAAQAAQRGAIVVGLDRAEAMVTLAAGTYQELTFVVGDAHAPPFPDGSFDAIVGNFLFHHLSDQRRALASWRRLLRPGGWLALTVWDTPATNRLMGLFADAVAAAGAVPVRESAIGPPMAAADNAYHEALRFAGYDPTSVGTIRFTLQLATADALWNRMLASSVRTAAMIAEQPDDVRERIRAAFDQLAEGYMTASGLAVPVSVKLLSGSMQALPKIVWEHHERLMRHVDHMPETGDLIGIVPIDDVRDRVNGLVVFLDSLLLPHMEATEHTLYPDLRRLAPYRDLLRSMRREHTQIRHLVGEVRRLHGELVAGSLSAKDAATLRRVIFRLYGLLKVHLAEEQQFLPSLERRLTPERANAMAVGMAHPGTDQP